MAKQRTPVSVNKRQTVEKGLRTDIILFVAGTTDPINSENNTKRANKSYWEGENNLCHGVKELSKGYDGVIVEWETFSWSGENSEQARIDAGNGLFNDVLIKKYGQFKKREVQIHLIGHSHGGNVINEFTKIIANGSNNFPSAWKVKSIVYLSTPFFNRMHQIKNTKFHPQCKILNIYNHFDITQRFVADFTLESWLPVFFAHINMSIIKQAKEEWDKTDLDKIKAKLLEWHMSDDDGKIVWSNTYSLLKSLRLYAFAVISSLYQIIKNKEGLIQDFLLDLERILMWLESKENEFNKTPKTYTRKIYITKILENINLLLFALDSILNIKTGVNDSKLFRILEMILIGKSNGLGILDSKDDTYVSPKKEIVGNYNIKDFQIKIYDSYWKSPKKKNYDSFITGLENCKSFKEIIARLLSQELTPFYIKMLIFISEFFNFLLSDDKWIETRKINLRVLKKANIYKKVIEKYWKDLVDEDSKEDIKPGSLLHLAMVSHSLSHTKYWDKVDEFLKGVIASKEKA